MVDELVLQSTIMADETMKEHGVLVERNTDNIAGLVIITLNRPKALNSLNNNLLKELSAVFKDLGNDPSVKVAILTGSGRAFCAGIDLKDAQSVFKSKDLNQIENDLLFQMEQCKFPIIGAINGYAITGGFELALGCDFLIASELAVFIDTHAKFGLMPAWGLSQKLSRMIGIGRAKQISLTSQPINAKMAEKWGLVNCVVPSHQLLPKAKIIATQIIDNQHHLVSNYKKLIDDGYDINYHDARDLERKRALDYYQQMKSKSFQEMKEFMTQRSKL